MNKDKKNILIYSNCAGRVIKDMFNNHHITKDKFNITYIRNYEQLHNKEITNEHKNILNTCNIFIYQPFNKDHDYSEYDIKSVIAFLPKNCLKIRVNYYRFYGFWYNNSYIPYENITINDELYKFLNMNNYGLHESFKNYNSENKDDIKLKIDNIDIKKDELNNYFNECLEKFKYIDNNSDVNMYEFFIDNYKNKHLFHDPLHPTNIFTYEIFRQLVYKIFNISIENEDREFINFFNNIEMTNWALPILPVIKQLLEINLPDKIYVFAPKHSYERKFLSVYDYYFIRLSEKNFETFINHK